MPQFKHRRTIFIWTEGDIREALKILDDSVLWCEQRKELGLYHMDSRIIVFSKVRNLNYFFTRIIEICSQGSEANRETLLEQGDPEPRSGLRH